jgi:ligand-binding sensor domain-containing protein/AraC-like DNA-binding protein/signal transduction histidine kinase
VIECLAEDEQGNIWVGTFSGGLNLLDRKKERFNSYQHDPANESSISGNRISVIFPDQDGKLWIGTDAGLDLFDIQKQTFTHFITDPQNPNSITPGAVSAIFLDHNGQLWIGTEGGLTLWDKEKKTFHRFTHQSSVPNSLAQNYVKAIYEDKYGDLWIGTWGGGLDKFIPSTQSFEHYSNQPSAGSLSNNSVLSLAGDNENLIYIGTENGGLNVFDIQHQTFSVYNPDITESRSINSNSVHTVYYDRENGMFWSGTYNGGINYFSIWDKPFSLYQAKINGLNNNHVTAITEDQQGNIWVGTDGGGVNVVNKRTGDFTYYAKRQSLHGGLQSDAILALLCDKNNSIWVGTYDGGIDLIRNREITHFTHNPDDPTSLSGRNVSVVYEDKRGNIWVGTMVGGLNLYQPTSRSFIRYVHTPNDPHSIHDNFIYDIYEDRTGRLLVLTGKGVEVFDYKTAQFDRFNLPMTAGIGVPVTLLEDSQGNLWIGSQERGLFRIDRTGVKVNTYTIEDGLPSNSICGILEDDFGNLWISTQRGLCKFEEGVINPAKISFQIYAPEDGLQGSEFKTGAFCKLKDGRMAFGGQNGFNVFDPAKIKQDPFVPPVSITGLKLFNKEVDFIDGKVLLAPISETESITFNYHQSVFTFEFSALSYMLAEKNQYAYMMEGFEDTWNYVGTQRSATYSNLDAGEYVFKVKAANHDGIWNEEGTRIHILIIPPWWRNLYFRLGVILLIAMSVIAYWRVRTFQLRRSKQELERQVALSTADLKKATVIIEERQNEILSQNKILVEQNKELENQTAEIKGMSDEIKELNEAKITFFSNISHELRAPLQLIVKQIEELRPSRGEDENQIGEKHNILYRNAKNLISRINQLLDFSGIEERASELQDELTQDIFQATSILIIEAEPNASLKYEKLGGTYHLEISSNGADGLRIATEHVPDLIVCDINLPDVSVVELCKTLKKDERTSHIPIIVMTSRSTDEGLSHDLETVTDDHVTKPFQMDLLELKIKNIFFSRQKLKELFLKGTLTLPDNYPISLVDEQFLQKAVAVVRDNLQASTFGVEEFSAHFGMSRRNVLRKMKGVTGLSINEYIRNTRLKEAYSLLNKGAMNISEVAYTVGFTDPKYFSNCFKKLFGKLPSEVKGMSEHKV